MLYIACLKEEGHLFSYQKAKRALKEIFHQDYEISTLRKEFSNLKTKKMVENGLFYRKPVPVLTQAGRLQIKTRLAFKPMEKWDNLWRLVVLDLPDKYKKERLSLLEKLESLGFGRWQKNSFISAYPLLGIVNKFSTHLGIRKFLRLAEISKIEDEARTIKETWELENINKQYKNFLKVCLIDEKSNLWLMRAKILENMFEKIYAEDPHLPQEFLPADWAGIKAYKKFKQLSNSY